MDKGDREQQADTLLNTDLSACREMLQTLMLPTSIAYSSTNNEKILVLCCNNFFTAITVNKYLVFCIS